MDSRLICDYHSCGDLLTYKINPQIKYATKIIYSVTLAMHLYSLNNYGSNKITQKIDFFGFGPNESRTFILPSCSLRSELQLCCDSYHIQNILQNNFESIYSSSAANCSSQLPACNTYKSLFFFSSHWNVHGLP